MKKFVPDPRITLPPADHHHPLLHHPQRPDAHRFPGLRLRIAARSLRDHRRLLLRPCERAGPRHAGECVAFGRDGEGADRTCARQAAGQ